MSLVVLVNVPVAAPAGTCTLTENVQLSSGPRLPPVKLNKDVPLIWEPVPQILVAGRPTAAAPVSMASRSSSKL